jgi:hypothetical protein
MAITTRIIDEQIFTGTVTHGGGTSTFDVPIPTDTCCYLECRTVGVHSSASHIDGTWGCGSYVISNRNGTLNAPAAITGSANPDNSAGLVGAAAEASDMNGGAGQPPTGAWSISSTNARWTVTNNSIANDVDVLVYVKLVIASNL